MATTTIFLPATPNFSHSSRSRSCSASVAVSVTRSSLTDQSSTAGAKRRLLTLISHQERGLRTQSDPQKLSQIIDAIDSLAAAGSGTVTTDESLSDTWRMLWTTEKEQLFIIKNAPVFGSAAGDVLQVIDVEKKTLNNVLTFPTDGVFFVRSDIQVASAQRINFQFTSAVLRGNGWEFPLPPFGRGWFESLYIDDEIRVVKDIRKDYLVVERAPFSWKE